MLTGLTNTIVNLFTPGGEFGGESGAKAMENGYPMAMFYVAGGPVAIEAGGHNDQDRRVLNQFDVPVQGKKAALAAIKAHGYELAGPPMRVGNPAMYVAPVFRVRRPR